MDSAHIVDDQERKCQVVCYVDFDDSKLWQLIPEFAESTTSGKHHCRLSGLRLSFSYFLSLSLSGQYFSALSLS